MAHRTGPIGPLPVRLDEIPGGVAHIGVRLDDPLDGDESGLIITQAVSSDFTKMIPLAKAINAA